MLTWAKRILYTLTLVSLLATNVLTLTSSAFNSAVSGAMSTVLGVRTVADVTAQRLAGKDRALKQASVADNRKRMAAKRFGSRLTARTKRVAARSIAAIPAESVPYLGIAAVLTATGYELYEACQSLRDLDDLYESLDLEVQTGDDTLQAVCEPQLPDAEAIWSGVKTQSERWIGSVMASS